MRIFTYCVSKWKVRLKLIKFCYYFLWNFFITLFSEWIKNDRKYNACFFNIFFPFIFNFIHFICCSFLLLLCYICTNIVFQFQKLICENPGGHSVYQLSLEHSLARWTIINFSKYIVAFFCGCESFWLKFYWLLPLPLNKSCITVWL